MTTIPDIFRPIRLCHGLGTEGQSACWMAAVSQYLGTGHKDKLECVSPVINQLCISMNDAFGDSDEATTHRNRVILDSGLVFAPVSTRDPENEAKRSYILGNAQVRIWLPVILRKSGVPDLGAYAARLEALPRIVDKQTRRAAEPLTKEISAHTSAHTSASTSASASAYAYASASASAYAYTYAYSSAYAYASDSAKDRADFVEQHIVPVLLEMIQAGKHAPREEVPVIRVKREKFLSACGVK